MSRHIATAAARRLFFVMPLAATLALSVSMPAAAAWSAQKNVSDAYINADMFDNDLVTQEGGYLHFFFGNEDGPTYQKTYLDGTPYGGETLLKLTASHGQAEGIASDGNLIVAVYSDEEGSSNTMEIRRSVSDGASWLPAQTIVSYTGIRGIGDGAVAVSGTTVLVAWTDDRAGKAKAKVFLRRSIDSGVTFGPRLLLGVTTADDYYQAVVDGEVHLAVSGAGAVAVWNASSTTGIYPKRLVMRRSTDGGATFQPVKTLDAGAQALDGPSVAMVGQEVLVSHATRAGDVRVLRSTNGGVSFGSTDLSGTKRTDNRTDVTIDPANAQSVRAVWFSHGKVYLRRSSNGGASWAAVEDTLARGPAASTISPNVVVSGGETVVGWNGLVFSPKDGYDANTVLARSDP